MQRFLCVGFYRCLQCQHRFRAFRLPGPRQMKLLWYAVGFVLFLIVFWNLLGYLSIERAAAE